MPWLTEPCASLPPKFAHLQACIHDAIAVPRAWILEDRPARDRAAVAELLARGPVIVRSAAPHEDTTTTSRAGLGLSVPHCATADDVVRAIERCRERDSSVAIMVQQQVERACLVVVAVPPLVEGPAPRSAYIEVHERDVDEPLAAAATPSYAGLLELWPKSDQRSALGRLCVAARTVAERIDPSGFALGLDLECIVDPAGKIHLVQLRPIVVDLFSGWDAFFDELRRSDQLEHLHGDLVLDAEHNPAPLSPAHEWLMQWLASQRPEAGQQVVLGGWLYVRRLVRDLGVRPGRGQPMAAVDALQHLCGTLLPHARERLHELEAKLATADREATASLIDEALSGFLAMIDAYLDVLVPARSRVDPADGFDRDDPLCLRNRDRYVDVLPAAWDRASPTLAELGVAGTVEVDAPALADVTLNRDAAHVLLAEWDDHLFALGLAPVRAVYRRAARLLGLNDDVFLLRGPEVVAMLREPATTVDLERRRATWARRARLRPPNRIQAGKPVAGDVGDRRLGVGIGPPFRGRATRRASLQAVLERPPPPGSVVILPALTAQAALVLKQLAISAVCTEHGGALSHGSLMARELGLSALIGCRACSSIPDGAEVYLDPIAGRITICG